MVIDWILVPVGWKIAGQSSLDSRLSDHRPVIAEARPAE
jgi:endonuclease/exonuclease/phosphatase (EEP) superfamily protein YafD